MERKYSIIIGVAALAVFFVVCAFCDLVPISTPGTGSAKINPKDGAEMVYVPAGEFIMGSGDDDPMTEDYEKPQHTVYLDAFWIYKTEVTNAQYRKCAEARACALPGKTRLYYDDSAYADSPVIYVDWYKAKA